MIYLALAVLVVLGVVATVTRGGDRERLGALIVAVACAAMMLTPERGADVWALFVIDLTAVVLLGRVAWKAPSLWPIWVMAALGVGAAASLAYMLQPDVDARTYERAMLLTRYAAATALLIGAGRRRVPHL